MSKDSSWQAIKKHIWRARQTTGVICVLAPWFVPAREGYLQRVAAIDAEVLDPLFCVHLDFETGCRAPQVSLKDERHLLVELVPHDKNSLRLAKKIVRVCGILYIHSVMRAMRDIMGDQIDSLFCLRGVTRIWDVHGAVPEEYIMQPNFFEAQNATHAEELLLQHADVMVTISESMRMHFQDKYQRPLPAVINTSVFNVTQVDTLQLIEEKTAQTNRFTAAYAGNLMPWQNIPLLQSLMCQAGERFDYRIFTPQPEAFMAMGRGLSLPQYDVCCATPQQVLQSYRHCHLGFVLRDDSAVNRVACPTKLMEYIQFGLIPVLKSADIGDFKAMGLQYIPWEDFAGLQLDMEKYQEMATHNFMLLKQLNQTHETGIAQLRTLVQGKVKEKRDRV